MKCSRCLGLRRFAEIVFFGWFWLGFALVGGILISCCLYSWWMMERFVPEQPRKMKQKYNNPIEESRKTPINESISWFVCFFFVLCSGYSFSDLAFVIFHLECLPSHLLIVPHYHSLLLIIIMFFLHFIFLLLIFCLFISLDFLLWYLFLFSLSLWYLFLSFFCL